MSEAISVGSVSVDIVPDVRKLPEELRAKTRDLSITVGTKLDDATLKREMDELTRERQVAIRANLDDTVAAGRLDELTRDRTIKIKADTSQARKAMSGMGSMGLLPSLALGLGPALIPAGAAGLGLAGALGAPLAAAGGGIAVGGAIAGAAVKQTHAQLKQIAELKKKMESAQASVSSASTPAGQAAAQAKLTQATLAYRNALGLLTPAQKRFKNSQDNLKTSFGNLIKVAGPAILGPVTKGMDLLSKVLPKLSPVLTPISKAIGSLLDGIGKAASGKKFDALLSSFGKFAGSSLLSFGHDLGNLATGFVGLFSAFSPLSGGLLSSIERFTQKFADFGAHASSNKGVQSFLAYVKAEGPKVAHTIGDIAGVVGKLVGGLAPLGDLMLGAIDGIARFLKKADPSTITALGIAVGGMAMAFGKGPLGLAFALGATLSHSDGFVSFLKKAGKFAGEMADAFDRLPAGVKAAAIGAVGVGVIAKKLSGSATLGLGKKAADVLFEGITKKAPLPVLVVNDLPGFKKDGAKKLLGKSGWAAALGLAAIPAIGGAAAAAVTPKGDRNPMAPGAGGYAGDGGLSLPSDALDFSDGVKKTTKAIHHQNDAWMKVRGNIDENKSAAKDLSDRILGIGRYIDQDATKANGLLAALNQVGSVYAGLPKALVSNTIANHDNKFDHLTGHPRARGPVEFHHHGNVVANKPSDYVKWNQNRHRRQSGGGVDY